MLLEGAIKDQYKEIYDRKKEAEALCSSRTLTPAALSGSNSGKFKKSTSGKGELLASASSASIKSWEKKDEHRVVPPPQVKQLGSLSGMGVDQFTDHDRFAAMVRFLSNPEVFEAVSCDSMLIYINDVFDSLSLSLSRYRFVGCYGIG